MSKPLTFAPVGRMNQDDSIIAPTPNYAGRNAFAEGDFRYIANARVGSSRSDNANDVQNIKDTVEKTAYKVKSQLFLNSDFTSNLNDWSQIDINPGNWVWAAGPDGTGCALIVPTCDDIMYQPVSVTAGDILQLQFKLTPVLINNFTSILFYVKFLQGTTVLSSQLVYSLGEELEQTVDIEIPANCNGIGFQAITTYSSGFPFFGISFAKLSGWTSGTRPVGTEKVIGTYENHELNKIFYAVYNSNNNHCIRYFDPVEDAVFELLKWSGLNYESTSFVSMAMIDNWLATAGRGFSPRLMNVDSISDLYNTLGSDFREFHISFHKWGPVMPPIVRAYYDGATNNYSKFEHKTYQWSYRYVYQNKLKSCFSPISNSAENFDSAAGNQITAIELFISGFLLDDPSAVVEYNYFGHDNIKFYSCVESIEIAYRESSTDVWRLFKRYTVESSDNTVFRFEGKADSTPIPVADFYQLFDTVPFEAGVVTAIDNRFMFADCLDEKDIAPAVQVTDVDVAKYDASLTVNNWWNFGNNDGPTAAAVYTGMSAGDALELALRNLLCDTTFKSRGLYKLGIQYLADNGWRSGAYTSEDFIIEIPAETGILDKLYAIEFKFPVSFVPPEWAVAYQIVRTNCLNIDYFMFGAANKFDVIIEDTSRISSIAAFSEEIRNRIRQHFEGAREVTGLEYNKYLETLKKKHFFLSMSSEVRKTVAAASLAAASRIVIDVNNWYNASTSNVGGTSNSPLNKLFYNYREGDRVRFLGSTQSATPSSGQKTVFDVPILEYNGIAIVVEKPAGLLWIPSDAAGTSNSDFIIEVYTPNTATEADYLYHESGEWYPVLYPGTSQRDFSKRDWTFTNDAAITCDTYGDIKVFNNRPFSYGDCHGINKTFYFDYKATLLSFLTSQYTASMNPDPSEMWGDWEKNIGRSMPGYADFPTVSFKKTQVRFGLQVIEESSVNQLNKFREENQKIYPSEYGRIRAMVNTANAQVESVGAILLAIGEKETFSIYVNRTTLEDLNGQTSVQLSDKILGSYNTLLGSHGTLNPESVSVRRGRVWFWDASAGEWIRYGRDGLTEISTEYKMGTWFKEIASLIRSKYSTSEAPLVISGFDQFSNELVTYINHTDLPSTLRGYSIYKGAWFDETYKAWRIHSYTPERFAGLDDDLYSFRGGSVYKHEAGSNYSTFYGTKVDVYIEPVFTSQKDVVDWRNMSIIASHGWSAERLLSEYRGALSKQQSSIALSLLKQQEGSRWVVSIPNDQNTPNKSAPMVTGNHMRSKALQALLKLDPAVVSLSLLHYVDCGQIDSPKN